MKSNIYAQFRNEVRSSVNQLNQDEDGEYDDPRPDVLSWEPLIPDKEYGAGSFSIENFSEDDLADVERKLSKVAKSIHERYLLRFNDSPLLEAAKHAFTIRSEQTEEQTRQLLAEVINSIPGPSRDLFDIEECLPGYKLFV